jgi:TM2 domain-containing membrane protein YozV
MDNMMRKSQMETKDLLLLESEVKSQGKNMVVAYVLWYFLGFFGGHRFYMGKTGSAIAQLILTITVIGFIATFIWWIVDAFKLHHWVKEHNSAIENRIMDQITMNKINQPTASVLY